MSVFLSIITINYNNASGLERTLQSVIHQKFKDYEFIVVDGDSTDGSKELLTAYQSQIHHGVSEKDNGIYHAMNKGIALAEGDYLLFLNSGDVLTSPSALGDFIHHPRFKGDIIYGDYAFNNGEKRYPDTLPRDYFMKTSLPHQSTLFKREVFEVMGTYDESYCIGADRAFFIQCFLSEQFSFQHIPYFLTLFDLSGMSNDPNFLARKKAEDERMFHAFYGSEYEEYKSKVQKEQRLKKAQRNRPKGMVKRIVNRLKKWCYGMG